MNRLETVYCAACRRKHPRYQAVPQQPLPRPSWRDTLRQSLQLIVGVAFVYGAAIVYFAAAYR